MAAAKTPGTTPDYWDDACKHLARRDRVMKKLIPRFPEGRLQSRGDAFTTLARSIVGQQISVKAAQSVWERFAGHVAQVELVVPLEGRKRFKGIAMGADAETARLRLDDGAEMRFPRGNIRRAKLVLTDELIAATAAPSSAALRSLCSAIAAARSPRMARATPSHTSPRTRCTRRRTTPSTARRSWPTLPRHST